ncbi:hypothetical protein ACJRO7_012803 [Eucalyptus globulus]|uniref:Uncharacterized protein n=1 Tax=Eucalyptus globulus TaxID=34317 RepID=A0ABD3LJU5_EUCGL
MATQMPVTWEYPRLNVREQTQRCGEEVPQSRRELERNLVVVVVAQSPCLLRTANKEVTHLVLPYALAIYRDAGRERESAFSFGLDHVEQTIWAVGDWE